MKPTFLLLVALAITPPLMAAQKPMKHHAPAKKEPAPTAGPTNFSVKGADGSTKNYSIEVPVSPARSEGHHHWKNNPASRCSGCSWVGPRILRFHEHSRNLSRLPEHADPILSRAPDGQGRRLHAASLRGRPR